MSWPDNVFLFPNFLPNFNFLIILAVNAFVSLKDDVKGTPQLSKELIMQVRKAIGPFAAPKRVIIVEDLPKTRSGKIMRRILRKILAGEEDQLGDTSTLADPSVVEKIIKTVHEQKKWENEQREERNQISFSGCGDGYLLFKFSRFSFYILVPLRIWLIFGSCNFCFNGDDGRFEG